MANLEAARIAILAAEKAREAAYLALSERGIGTAFRPVAPDVLAQLEADYVAVCNEWTVADAAWMAACREARAR